MSTAVDGAADDDDDPFSGNWRDQFTNEYTVTGCKGTYSVTINHKQDGAKCGTTETLAGIIKRDANGGYTWGITHKLHIRDDGNLVWNALKEDKKAVGMDATPLSAVVQPKRNQLASFNDRPAEAPEEVSRKSIVN